MSTNLGTLTAPDVPLSQWFTHAPDTTSAPILFQRMAISLDEDGPRATLRGRLLTPDGTPSGERASRTIPLDDLPATAMADPDIDSAQDIALALSHVLVAHRTAYRAAVRAHSH